MVFSFQIHSEPFTLPEDGADSIFTIFLPKPLALKIKVCYIKKLFRAIPFRANYGALAQLGARYNRVPAPHTKLNKKYPAHPLIWGYSSAGRALEWHSRGQRFDPAYLHHRMRWVFLDNLSCVKASFFFCLFPAGNGFLFLCGDFHNVQPQAELCKVNVEINVQLVVPIDLHPTDQAVDDHFLCLQAGRVI